MAHSILHFSAGLILGTVAFAGPVLRGLQTGMPVAARARRWLLLAYATGVLAVVPGFLRRLGMPEAVCTSAWMNVFVLHPLINQIKSGGMLVGELLFLACFGFQYAVLLMAILMGRCAPAKGPVP